MTYLIGALCISTFPSEWKPRDGEEWEHYLGGGMGKVGPLPRGRQTICFALAMVLWGGGGG